MGTIKAVFKEIHSENMSLLDDISLKTNEEKLAKSIAPLKDEYYFGAAVYKVFRRWPSDLYEHNSGIVFDNKDNKNISMRGMRGDLDGVPFERYVDIKNVLLNNIYKFNRMGKVGGTLEFEGIDHAFMIYKKDNDFFMSLKSKELRQLNHIPLAKKK